MARKNARWVKLAIWIALAAVGAYGVGCVMDQAVLTEPESSAIAGKAEIPAPAEIAVPDSEMEERVVQGTRTDGLREVPVAVTQFGVADLENRRTSTLHSLGYLVDKGAPNLRFRVRDAVRPLPLPVVNDAAYPDMYFEHFGVNPTIDTEEDHLSTFSVDVDNASYAMARSYLERGNLPPEDAIRVEEFVNAFDYAYDAHHSDTFEILAEAFPSPNREGYHVLHIGLKGKEVRPEARKRANLVFVIDVSGSMSRDNRLGLVKRSLRMLVDQLREDDTVGIVVYGSQAHTLLEPVSVANRERILAAIDALRSEGSTNAQAGIALGYQMVARHFSPSSINRVILCSDGVANNGIATDADGIFATVKEQAARGVTVSTIGFGMGNYNDVLMERLAQIGDGNYYYVDRDAEAHRVFVENLTGTLQVIARDVKIQVDFDRTQISRFRLLGYENRQLEHRDFDDDLVDAGEIGAGHTVTALYEIKFRDRVRDFGELRVRYKDPEGGASRLIRRDLRASVVRDSFAQVSAPTQLSYVVAEFAEVLRGSYWARNLSYAKLRSMYDDIPASYRNRDQTRELAELIAIAERLDSRADRFEGEMPVARMDFDRVPILE